MTDHLRGRLTPSALRSHTWVWAPAPDLHAGGADLAQWEHLMTVELGRLQYEGAHIDLLGDFPTDSYLTAWLDIARVLPDVEFYAVTSEVDRMARLAEPDAPDNFRWTSPDEQFAARRGQSVEGQAADGDG